MKDSASTDRRGSEGPVHDGASVSGAIESSRQIARAAIEELSPDYIISMVSGGKDSAASHAVAVELGVPVDLIIHGNTRTGIPETTQFVQDTYGAGATDFAIADAGTAYEDYVLRKGFFGVGRNAHNFSYRVLKAQPFRKAVSRLLRQRRRGIKVLLLNGARKSESENRRKRLQLMRSDPASPGNIWLNIIHEWSQEQRDAYLESKGVPINPVAKALCRSGECMCGTMQSKAERIEASALYPDWGRRLDELEAEARRLHGFGWGEDYPKRRDWAVSDMFQPMCSDCIRT